MDEKLIEVLSNQIGAKLAGWDLKTDKDSGTFTTVITSEVVDRDGEIILLQGRDFANFMKNPQVLRGHNYWDFPVGKCTGLSIVDGKVIATGEFASEEANPKAQQVRKLYEGGFINAVSVGFRVLQRNPNNRLIIEKQELLEFSFVTVPANPEAMGLGKWVKAYMESSLNDENIKDGVGVHYATYVFAKDATVDDEEDKTPPVVEGEELPATDDGEVTLDKIYNVLLDLSKSISTKSVANDTAVDADFILKEAVQEVNRTTSEALRNRKQAQKS